MLEEFRKLIDDNAKYLILNEKVLIIRKSWYKKHQEEILKILMDYPFMETKLSDDIPENSLAKIIDKEIFDYSNGKGE